MVIDPQALIAPFVAAAIPTATLLFAFNSRIAVLETKIDQLNGRVEKHNTVIERTFKLESDSSTMWRRIDEQRDRMEHLENRLDEKVREQ